MARSRDGLVVQNVGLEPVADRQGNLRQMLGVLPRCERIFWTGAAKLVLPEAGPPALFDLAADPEERRNLLVGRYVNRAG